MRSKKSAPACVSTTDPTDDSSPRQQMIAEAAYFRAERRNFAPGSELSDWLEAESEIDRPEEAGV